VAKGTRAKRFPALKGVVAAAAAVDPKKWVNALAYLGGRSAELKRHESADELVFRHVSGDASTNGDYFHLGVLTAAVVVALRRDGIIVGSSVVEELLFYGFREGNANPVAEAVERIHQAGLHHAGLLIYPLHSFGVAGVSARLLFTDNVLTFAMPALGMMVTPQTNSWARTRTFMQNAADALDVPRKLPWEMLEHWKRSRPVGWLTSNPVAIIKVSNFPGSFYENTRYLVQAIGLAAGSIHLAFAVQQPELADTDDYIFSTAHTNNWETLDARHFLSLFPDAAKKNWLSGDCIPFSASPAALADLCDWSIDVDPAQWQRRKPTLGRITAAISHLSIGQHRHSKHGYGADDSGPARFYQKIALAVTHFRRSFQRSALAIDRVVSLATAFEALLTDHFARGVETRLVDHASILMRGTRGTLALQRSVGEVYTARCEILHQGRTPSAKDALSTAQKAFALCFLRLMELASKHGAPTQANAVEQLLAHA
jgi:hypothetical protein